MLTLMFTELIHFFRLEGQFFVFTVEKRVDIIRNYLIKKLQCGMKNVTSLLENENVQFYARNKIAKHLHNVSNL